MQSTNCLVTEPPIFENRFSFQEECCWNLRGVHVTPSRTLHVASHYNAEYVPPLKSWEELAAVAKGYDSVAMILTPPLWKIFHGIDNVARETNLRLIVNPAAYRGWVNMMLTGIECIGVDEIPHVTDERFEHLYTGETVYEAAGGCHFKCGYCPWKGQTMHWSDPHQAARIVNASSKCYLLCPQATGNRKWLDTFCAECKSEFNTDLNAVHVDKFANDIRRLADCGMYRAIVGTETFSESALSRLNCPHTIQQSRKMMELLSELKTESYFQLRSGYGETVDEVNECAEFLRQTEPINKENMYLNTGPLFYWYGSSMTATREREVLREYNGMYVATEQLPGDVNDAWKKCFEVAREAGWTVR